MIIYEPLWKTMKERKVSQYRLIKHYGFSSGQLNRLKNNQYVSTHTIGVLCTILDCSVEDIMEFRMDNSELAFPNPSIVSAGREDAAGRGYIIFPKKIKGGLALPFIFIEKLKCFFYINTHGIQAPSLSTQYPSGVLVFRSIKPWSPR